MNGKGIFGNIAILVMASIVGIAILSSVAMAAGQVHNIKTGVDYTSIQAAINAASAGDKIYVDSGTYYENVNVNKSLTLKGIDIGGGKPVVDGRKLTSSIILSAGNSTLDGFVAINSSYGWFTPGIKINSSNNIIRNDSSNGIVLLPSFSNNNTLIGNIVLNSYGPGIYLYRSSNNTLNNNIMSNNGYAGIYLYSYSSNNTVDNNTISNNGYAGIYMDSYVRNNALNSNIISNNKNAGIYLYSFSSNNILNSNIISNNVFAGIYLDSSSNNNTLNDNTALNNNKYAGISLYYSNDNTLTGNNASNTNFGISLERAKHNILIGNILLNNSYAGIYLDPPSSGNMIYNNNFINNSNQAWDYSVNLWDNGYSSGGNYWSDYIGIDDYQGLNQDQLGSDGIGDTPYNIPKNSSQDRYPLMTPYNGEVIPTPTPTPSPSPTPTNQPPNQPTLLKQFRADGTTEITTGGAASEKTVTFKATVSDPDNDQVKLQIELRRLDEYGGNFDETQGGLKESDLVPSGSEVTITVNDLINDKYHWRARAIDANGNKGPWQEFGGNPTTDTDFVVVKQIVKILVVPAGYDKNADGNVDDMDINAIKTIENGAMNYHLKSSYGAIYLDFYNEQPVTLESSVDLENGLAVMKEALTKKPVDYSKYSIVVVADGYLVKSDGKLVTHFAYPPEMLQDTIKLDPPIAIPAAFVGFGGDKSLGTWVHELGHVLGRVVESSHIPKSSPLYGILPDLYGTSKEPDYLGNTYSIDGWDLMAAGSYVYNSIGSDKVNQPTDLSVLSKTELGWLAPNPVATPGEYPVMSTENMRYEDPVLSYKPPSSKDAEYYIEARELLQPSYFILGSKNPPVSLNNGIAIYKKSTNPDTGTYSIDLLKSTTNSAGPTFLASDGTSAEYTDCSELVKFKVSESNANHPYNAKIKISQDNACTDLKGMEGDFPLPKEWKWSKVYAEISNPNATYPDLDLHAYTSDGLHVGPNRTNGEYDMQIPGAIASGDTNGGKESIFVPKDIQVQYYVSSHDVEEYLKDHPEIDPANVTVNYSTKLIEYGDNPRLTQLPDGNWTISNRTVSIPKESTIGPGTTNEVITYNFSGFLQPINADGSSIFKLGSTVNVKFQLRYQNGSFATSAVAKIYITKINNGILGNETEAVSTSAATEGNLFRYDSTSNQYIFNLATKSLTVGTYQIRIELDDGTSKYVQIGLK